MICVFILLIAILPSVYVSRDPICLPRLPPRCNEIRLQSDTLFVYHCSFALLLIRRDGVVTYRKSSRHIFKNYFYYYYAVNRMKFFPPFLSANDKMKDGEGRPNFVSFCVEWKRAQRPMFRVSTIIDLFFAAAAANCLPLCLWFVVCPQA